MVDAIKIDTALRERRGGLCGEPITYYVALPFVQAEEGILPGEAQEVPSENLAIRRAEALSRKPEHVGAFAFKRGGDPNLGAFDDAVILRAFGNVYGRCGPNQRFVVQKVENQFACCPGAARSNAGVNSQKIAQEF